MEIKNLISQTGYAKKHNLSRQIVHYYVKQNKLEVVKLQDGTILINDK